jgi:gamma-glutamylcyclotransferase (GGCT)/AIG2-like uncharacterized protein YtfP
MFNIFVYGTLLEENTVLHKMLEVFSKDKYPSYFNGRMFTSGYYPIVTDGENKVKGIVYKIDDDRILEILDEYEGVNRFNCYKRNVRYVIDMFDEVIETYIYMASNDMIKIVENNSIEIKNGDWIDYKLKEMDKHE